MRTTLSIDDDVLAAAKSLAQRQHTSLGEVISALARAGLTRSQSRSSERNGVPLLSRDPKGPVVTMELINQLRDEII